jgi:hypothetical protein
MREYLPGQEVHIYTWPTIYSAADGASAPYVESWPLAIRAGDDVLRALVPNQMVHFWGIVGPDGKSLEVAGFEPLDGNTFQTMWLQGTIERAGDQVRVHTADGQSYILPDAPADLPDGLEVEMSAWASRDAGLELPVLDWDYLAKRIVYEEPAVVEPELPVEPAPEMWQPHVYGQVTIEGAELITYLAYVQDEAAMAEGRFAPPTIVVQPTWRLTGTADNGDVLRFYVQAVSPEYIGD